MKKIAIAFALVLLAVTMLPAADSWSGWISDEACATAGKVKGEGHAGCAKGCLGKEGAKAALVTDDGKVVKIANLDKVKEFAGQHVTVTGKLDGEKLTVETAKADK